jgi:hypothetical protein
MSTNLNYTEKQANSLSHERSLSGVNCNICELKVIESFCCRKHDYDLCFKCAQDLYGKQYCPYCCESNPQKFIELEKIVLKQMMSFKQNTSKFIEYGKMWVKQGDNDSKLIKKLLCFAVCEASACAYAQYLEVFSRLEHINKFKFLNLEYFKNNDKFIRNQDINNKYFNINPDSKILFISHRWVDPDDPDKNHIQFNMVKKYILSNNIDNCAVWYDFSCMPQKPRNSEDEVVFKQNLSHLDKLTMLVDQSIMIDNIDYHTRAWCVAESLVMRNPIVLSENKDASNISYDYLLPLLLMRQRQGHVKYNNEVKEITNITVEKTKATNGSDLEFIKRMISSYCNANMNYLIEKFILLLERGGVEGLFNSIMKFPEMKILYARIALQDGLNDWFND